MLLYLGDEIVSINGQSVKGKTKVQVAKLIQEIEVRGLLSLSSDGLLLVVRSHDQLQQIACSTQGWQNTRHR